MMELDRPGVSRIGVDMGSPRLDVLMPAPLIASGGHRTAVMAAESLSAAGFDVHLHFQRPDRLRRSAKTTSNRARLWHEVVNCTVHTDWPDSLPDSQLVMATNWQSAAVVATCETPAVRVQFVQDYEPWFHARGYESIVAESSYEWGLRSIVIGNWLRWKLRKDHGLLATSLPFTADATVYNRPASSPSRRRVVAVYQPSKTRRCPELMAATLSQLQKRDPTIEIATIGSKTAPQLALPHEHLGTLSPADLAATYQQSAVGFSISASNPSRMPFEMMAAGLPVVELGLANTMYDFPNAGCVLAHPDPHSLAEALLEVINDEERRSELSSGGHNYMADFPQELEQETMLQFVVDALNGVRQEEVAVRPLYEGLPVRADVLVPWRPAGAAGRSTRVRNSLRAGLSQSARR